MLSHSSLVRLRGLGGGFSLVLAATDMCIADARKTFGRLEHCYAGATGSDDCMQLREGIH